MARRLFTLEQAYLEVVKRLRPNQAILRSTENGQLHLYEVREEAESPGVLVMMYGRAYAFVRYMEPEEVPDV